MPIDTGELLTENVSHENNFSCEDRDRIRFDELKNSIAFSVNIGEVVALRNYTPDFLLAESIKVDMVYGSGLGTDYKELIIGTDPVALRVNSIKFLVTPGRYRLRYVGARPVDELIVTFNTYPNPQIDYTRLALA